MVFKEFVKGGSNNERYTYSRRFLKRSTYFFLTTVDGNKPKCRPIGFHLLKDEKIYFGVGTFKDVYRQMTENPYVEICACKGGKFIRYYGKAIFEDNDKIARSVLEKSPGLKKIYNEESGHQLGIFHLEDVKVEFHVMSKLIETYSI